MSEYRLYCLGGDGKIEAAEEITASGDAEAIMIAKSMKKPVKCELWERGRMVALIDAYRAWPEASQPKRGRNSWHTVPRFHI